MWGDIARGQALELRYPPATRGRLVLWGLLASAPYGGMTWQVLHHLVGFRRLGFDVWYVQDSDSLLTDPATYWPTMAYERNLAYLAEQMDRIGLGDRWVFRAPGQRLHFGALDRAGLQRLYADADAVFNLCGAQEILPHHDDIQNLVLLETDPVFMQIGVTKEHQRVIDLLARYNSLFTYGSNLFGEDCALEIERFDWRITRPPVILDWWQVDDGTERDVLTTIANWKHRGKDIEWDGARLRWTKHRQFNRFWDVARQSPIPLEVALLGASDAEKNLLASRGWAIRSAESIARPDSYRAYIQGSRGEFSFAKEMVVETNVGWLSDRTVCYLAAGKPAIVQDTGVPFAKELDGGLNFFSDTESALAAIDAVASNYQRQSQLATELARSRFSAELVLGEIATSVGLA